MRKIFSIGLLSLMLCVQFNSVNVFAESNDQVIEYQVRDHMGNI